MQYRTVGIGIAALTVLKEKRRFLVSTHPSSNHKAFKFQPTSVSPASPVQVQAVVAESLRGLGGRLWDRSGRARRISENHPHETELV